MINEQFNKLIPYVSENFITYPLWEEGKYIPFVNFWYIQKTNKDVYLNIENFSNKNYNIIQEEEYGIIRCQIFPTFEDSEELGYIFVKDNWSIEEMIK